MDAFEADSTYESTQNSVRTSTFVESPAIGIPLSPHHLAKSHHCEVNHCEQQQDGRTFTMPIIHCPSSPDHDSSSTSTCQLTPQSTGHNNQDEHIIDTSFPTIEFPFPNAEDTTESWPLGPLPDAYTWGGDYDAQLHTLLFAGVDEEQLPHQTDLISIDNMETSEGSKKDPPEWETFARCCYRSCILRESGRDKEADTLNERANSIFDSLVKQAHDWSLACLHLVLGVLVIYGRSEEAKRLLQRARDVALRYHGATNPFIMTINFMIQQAADTVRESRTSVRELQDVYESFWHELSPRHPFTLLAGYHVVWRITIDDDEDEKQTSFWHAYHLLRTLQADAEKTMEQTHPQYISILTTMARTMCKLKNIKEGLEIMEKAVRLTAERHSALLPYHLEVKRKYAAMLDDSGQGAQAEEIWQEVALGRAEILGSDHPISKETTEGVEDFLSESGRESELQYFRQRLAVASNKHRLPIRLADF